MNQMNGRGAPRPAPQPRHTPAGRPYAPGPRPAAPRHPAAPRTARGAWRELLLLAAGGIVVAVLALALQAHWPNGFPLVKAGAGGAAGAARAVSEIHADGPLRINEIMTGNRGSLVDGDGESPDWVEIANAGNGEVNLSGWSLAKTEGSGSVFTFPEMTLEPQQCALVLADSRLRDGAGDELHAPFRLSSAGDTLMLFNPAGTAVDTVNIPALAADCAYARTGRSEWEQSSAPTPGLPNTEDSLRALSEPDGTSPVILSEVVASNASVLADANGQYYDYIELYNRSTEAVDLTGWHLSDDVRSSRKWSFPELQIAAGEYLVVYASGLDRRDDPAQLHANFSLSSEGEQAVLTDASGRVMDRTDFGLLKADEAWALGTDGTWRKAAPLPGAANP